MRGADVLRKFPEGSTDLDYDIFEQFPDGSIRWRACIFGMEGVESVLLDLSKSSGNNFFAIRLRSRPLFMESIRAAETVNPPA
jgi:hypothetical protein